MVLLPSSLGQALPPLPDRQRPPSRATLQRWSEAAFQQRDKGGGLDTEGAAAG